MERKKKSHGVAGVILGVVVPVALSASLASVAIVVGCTSDPPPAVRPEPAPFAAAPPAAAARPSPPAARSAPQPVETEPPAVTRAPDRRDPPPAVPTPAAHLLIDVAQEAGGFRVVRAMRVDSPIPRRRGATRGLAWRFRAVAADGTVLYEGELADPAEIRGEFRAPSDPRAIDAVHLRRPLPIYFAIRVPFVRAARIEFARDSAPLGSVPFPSEARE